MAALEDSNPVDVAAGDPETSIGLAQEVRVGPAVGRGTGPSAIPSALKSDLLLCPGHL